MSAHFIWNEKYRPSNVDSCVLPQSIKTIFKTFVEHNNIPNLLLCGSSGIGKTTIAKAVLEEMDCDYIVINGSLNRNIDTVRNEIMEFASSVSIFKTGRKYVLIDEADGLNPQSTQPSLRNFMEEYAKNCGFILTCNNKNKIIEALQSRCSIVDFKIDSAEKAPMMVEFYKRVQYILKQENITYDKKVIGEYIKAHFPDMRRVINELQYHSTSGVIDTNILLNMEDENFSNLVDILKKRKFNDMKKWVAENVDIDFHVISRKIFDRSDTILTGQSLATIILLINEYQYKSAFVADQEINTNAFLTEFMTQAEWK